MTHPVPHFFDLETRPFGPGCMAPRPVCLSWAEPGREPGLVGPDGVERHASRMLDRALAGEVVLAAHVAAYDFSCLLAHHPSLGPRIWRAYAENRITCTNVRERLLDIATIGYLRKDAYSLAALAAERLGERLDKGDDSPRTMYGELEAAPIDAWPERARRYAVDDSRVGLALYLNQEERARAERYAIPTQHMDSRADFALRLAGCWGIRTDGDRVRALDAATSARMRELSGTLVSAGLARPINGRQIDLDGVEQEILIRKDMAAIAAAIERSYPGTPPRTGTGKVRTDKETIGYCSDPALGALVEFNALQKSGSTYVRKLYGGIGGQIHAAWYGVGAASDRAACRDPNLMNQPRMPGVRECFVPRPGHTFVDADFDSQEMRTLAQSCLDVVGKSRLADMYRADPGFDPHQELADQHPRIVANRQRAKCSNFGLPGGLGKRGMVKYARGRGVELTEDEAGDLKRAWFLQWPEMGPYFDHVSSIVGGGKGAVTIPRSGFRRAMCGYTDAANTYFQTLAAHASKEAMFEVARKCYDDRNSSLHDSRPVLFVHDEIAIETPLNWAHEAAAELERVMAETMARWTPDVPTSATACAATCWSKNAERIVENGRLVPWEP